MAITVRDHAQTLELTRREWSSPAVVGGDSPRDGTRKATALARRVRDLVAWGRGTRIDVALSHNSYAQIVAARLLGIPAVTAMDFEHQPANHLAFRVAQRVVLPEALRKTNVVRQGATPAKTVFYPGLKEEFYIGDFEPDRQILRSLGVERSGDERVVVTRTPPTRAIYHRFSNSLFAETLVALDAQPDVCLVVLARHPEERAAVERLSLRRCVVPAHAVDARSLMYAADLVVGAGGTMTREAALLGVPTISVFGGDQPAVDRWLEGQKMLRRIRTPNEATPVRRRQAEPRPREELLRRAKELLEVFLRTVETVPQSSKQVRGG